MGKAQQVEKHPMRVWRFENDWSLADLAAEAGLAASYLGEIERGVRPCGANAALAVEAATDGEVTLDEMIRWGR